MGLDLSLGMLRSGASTNRFPLCQGDMRELPFRDSVFAAIVAYYSIHNVTRTELGMVLAEAARVLRPGATLLLSTHLGEGEVYSNDFLGHHIATTGGQPLFLSGDHRTSVLEGLLGQSKRDKGSAKP